MKRGKKLREKKYNEKSFIEKMYRLVIIILNWGHVITMFFFIEIKMQLILNIYTLRKLIYTSKKKKFTGI